MMIFQYNFKYFANNILSLWLSSATSDKRGQHCGNSSYQPGSSFTLWIWRRYISYCYLEKRWLPSYSGHQKVGSNSPWLLTVITKTQALTFSCIPPLPLYSFQVHYVIRGVLACTQGSAEWCWSLLLHCVQPGRLRPSWSGSTSVWWLSLTFFPFFFLYESVLHKCADCTSDDTGFSDDYCQKNFFEKLFKILVLLSSVSGSYY